MRAALIVLVLAVHGSAAAQSRPRSALPFAPRDEAAACALARCEDGAAWPVAARELAQEAPRRATPWAILASAVVPGSGQALLRSERFLPYVAFEAFAWAQYLSHARSGRRQRDAYRALARDVARAAYGPDRPNGDFEYYERMEHFTESGAFDAIPGGKVDPELDTLTYNGSIWLLARRTYWQNIDEVPDDTTNAWKFAMALYQRRAYGSNELWSWRDAPLEYDEFRRLIRQSNDANRRALTDLGIILANHALSTVDAYVTVRIRRRDDADVRGYEVGATLPLGRPRGPGRL
jgi:hypothetical protein